MCIEPRRAGRRPTREGPDREADPAEDQEPARDEVPRRRTVPPPARRDAAAGVFEASLETCRAWRRSRLRRASTTLNTEGEDSMKAFREQMKAIRGRM
jgi:hypothetical protein